MKVDRIRAVRDKIASLGLEKFTMADTCTTQGVLAFDLEHDCNTAGCIAGWTCFLFAPDRLPSCWLARNLLGLSEEVAAELFSPEHKALSRISRDEATQTLTHLIETGTVQWA